MRNDLTTTVDGDPIAVWHYPGQGDAFAGPAGRPAIVMAHGLGATRDSGLTPYAEAFCNAGVDVLLFDYRRLGDSGGEPRQLVDVGDQRADFHGVIALARTLDGVDPDRVVLWGTSMGGAHVLHVGSEDPRLAAVVAMTPAADGRAALVAALKREGPLFGARLTVLGIRDKLGALLGRPPLTVPICAAPGEMAVLTAPGAAQELASFGGPTWNNEIAARIGLVLGLYRPVTKAGKLQMPLFVHVADNDQSVPSASQVAVARKGNAEVRHLPADHFDVYGEKPLVATAIEHQLQFLRQTLGAREPVPATT